MDAYDDFKREFLLEHFIAYYGGADNFAAKFYAEQVELFVAVCDEYPRARIGAEFADVTILGLTQWAWTRRDRVERGLTAPCSLKGGF